MFDTGKEDWVYNLEVADFHTYFVGEERAWVHNTCLEHLHHAIPKFMGGDVKQLRALLTQGQHVQFHDELRVALKAKGFPYDASNTSAATWAKYFQDNPGSQEKAFQTVLDASRSFDDRYGTNIESAFLYNLLGGRFAPY